jgi:predicted nuclease of restriction endonuclease-like RecB superfamily
VLTSEQSIVSYERGAVIPDRLTRRTHAHYVAYAERMVAAYQRGVGRTRRELHKAVEAILADEPDCNSRRVSAFCRILDDLGEFDRDDRGRAAKLRLQVFSMAAKYHPLVTAANQMFERTETEVKSLIAAELGQGWAEIDAALYADVIDQQRLIAFDGVGGDLAELLSRYNVGQLQACLYRATRLTIKAAADLAAIVRRAKLCRLLLDIRRIDPVRQVHRIELSGPSAVLRESRRYGVNFARFVPTLLACRDWTMRAAVVTPWHTTVELRLSSGDGYRSHLAAPAEFDSEVEAALAKAWGDSCDGWQLSRQAGILHSGQATFVPDFLLRHEDGREAYLEIVGFWTPQYLAAKRATLAKFAGKRIVLAVAKRSAKASAGGRGLVVYNTRIKPQDVVRAVEELGSFDRSPGSADNQRRA